MKEFGVSDHDYEHRISVPLRTIMCIDLPRIDYDSNKKVKKSDVELVNRLNAESEIRAAAKNKAKREAAQATT